MKIEYSSLIKLAWRLITFGAWFACTVEYLHHRPFFYLESYYLHIVKLYISFCELVIGRMCSLLLMSPVFRSLCLPVLWFTCTVLEMSGLQKIQLFGIKNDCKIILIIFCQLFALSSSSTFPLSGWDIFTCIFELSTVCVFLSVCG